MSFKVWVFFFCHLLDSHNFLLTRCAEAPEATRAAVQSGPPCIQSSITLRLKAEKRPSTGGFSFFFFFGVITEAVRRLTQQAPSFFFFLLFVFMAKNIIMVTLCRSSLISGRQKERDGLTGKRTIKAHIPRKARHVNAKRRGHKKLHRGMMSARWLNHNVSVGMRGKKKQKKNRVHQTGLNCFPLNLNWRYFGQLYRKVRSSKTQKFLSHN